MVAKYMAIISISYSVARVLSSTLGMGIISKYGYNLNWVCMIALGVLGFALSLWLQQIIVKEEKQIQTDIVSSIFQSRKIVN